MTVNKNLASKKPKGARFENKRTEVLRAAARVFARLGFRAASLSDVADDLGVTPAALYYYVDSKDALLLETSLVRLDGCDAVAAKLKDDPRSGRVKLTEYFLIYADGVGDEFGRCLALTNPNEIQSAEYRQQLNGRRRKMDHDVRDIIKGGIADGSIEDCDVSVLTAMLFGTANDLGRWCLPGGRLSTREAMQVMMDIVMDGVASGNSKA
jgi:AcrR family transcriptional regulator